MADARREKVYELLDDLLENVGELQAEAFAARNSSSYCWLASAEDAIAEFIEKFDDAVDAQDERRWDRANERSMSEGDNYPAELAAQMAEARKIKR